MRFAKKEVMTKDGRKCGFTESGRRHHALRFDDGSCHDEILMYKEL